MEIGKSLKEAREARGLSLSEVEEETKIRRKYLQALENEQYDVLPGQVYTRAFLKSYARFLNLNVEEVMEAFNYSHGQEDTIEHNSGQKSEQNIEHNSVSYSNLKQDLKLKQKPRNWLYLATIVIILGLSISIYYATQGTGFNRPGREELQTVEQGVNANDQSNPPAAQQPATNTQPGVRLTFNVIKDTCWMRVIVDGTPAFQGVVTAGQTQEYTGNERVSFRLGNAGVVQVELNGQDLGFLGEEGAVIDREFTASPTD